MEVSYSQEEVSDIYRKAYEAGIKEGKRYKLEKYMNITNLFAFSLGLIICFSLFFILGKI